jgi:hypothetical protein
VGSGPCGWLAISGWGDGVLANGCQRRKRIKGTYSEEVKLIKEITRMGIEKKTFVSGGSLG